MIVISSWISCQIVVRLFYFKRNTAYGDKTVEAEKRLCTRVNVLRQNKTHEFKWLKTIPRNEQQKECFIREKVIILFINDWKTLIERIAYDLLSVFFIEKKVSERSERIAWQNHRRRRRS